jgi:putative aldouronate transport system substrate-binding protein
MRKNFKAAVSVSLCMLLIFSATACKKEKDSGPSPSSSASQEPVTIKWLNYDCVGQPDPSSPIIQAIEKKFNAKFDFMYIDPNNWDDQLNVRLSAGDIPDTLWLKDQAHIANYVRQGLLQEMPWNDIMKKAPNYAKIVAKYDKQGIMPKAAMNDGKNYGFLTINLDYTYPTPIIWRTDWLKNVGINSIPTTLSATEEALLKFRNNDPDQDGKKDTYGMSNSMIPIIYASYGITDAGACLLTTAENGKIVFSSTTPQAKQALTTLASWYKQGIIDPEFITGEHTTGYWATSNAFDNGRIGVSGLGSFYHWTPPLYDGDKGSTDYQDFMKINPNGQYSFGKAIVGPTGKSGAIQPNYVTGPQGVTVQGAKKARVMDTFLAMLDAAFDTNDRDYYLLNTAGIKDVTYSIDANNKITTIGSRTPAQARQLGLGVLFLSSPNPDLRKEYESVRYNWADKNMNYTGIAVPFISPTKDYMDATAQYLANLQKLTLQAYNDMITGKVDVNTYFDGYVKQFNANGGTAIENAANAANKTK